MSTARHVNSEQVRMDLIRQMTELSIDGAYEVTIKKLPKTRTAKQNRALHQWCRMVAESLNGGGYSVPIVLEKVVDSEWDGDAVKSLMWKKVQKNVIGKESTADASTDEYTPVYDVLNRFLGEKFGVSIPWPVKKEGAQ